MYKDHQAQSGNFMTAKVSTLQMQCLKNSCVWYSSVSYSQHSIAGLFFGGIVSCLKTLVQVQTVFRSCHCSIRGKHLCQLVNSMHTVHLSCIHIIRNVTGQVEAKIQKFIPKGKTISSLLKIMGCLRKKTFGPSLNVFDNFF